MSTNRTERPGRWVVFDAQITNTIDATIEDRPGEAGLSLTIVDMDSETTDESTHSSVEDAKKHASVVTGVQSVRWRRR